jgi:hypothetical protein
MKVKPEIYEDLAEHFSDEGKKVSFLTYGKMFYHVLKAREESQAFRDLYIQDIEVPHKALMSKKVEEFTDVSMEANFDFDNTFEDSDELF